MTSMIDRYGLIFAALLVGACGSTSPPADGGVSADAGRRDAAEPASHAGAADAGRGCFNDDDCTDDEVCDYRNVASGCGVAGECVPRPMLLPECGGPMCACDGMTYDECDLDGRRVEHPGPCPGG